VVAEEDRIEEWARIVVPGQAQAEGLHIRAQCLGLSIHEPSVLVGPDGCHDALIPIASTILRRLVSP
jgi:hypothetical protein